MMSIRFRTWSDMLLAAEPSEKLCETDLCRNIRQSWATVRQDTTDATRWTDRESEKGWKATKARTKDAAHDTPQTGQDQSL